MTARSRRSDHRPAPPTPRRPARATPAGRGLAEIEARDITAWFGTAQGARPGLADHARRRASPR